MKINGMEDFQHICRTQLVKSYNYLINYPLTYDETFIVWACKTLQNYKCLAATTVSGDGVYVEYTYNGDKEELYEDFYVKKNNRSIKED